MPRNIRIGARHHRATVSQHDGTQGSHGNPTYTTTGDWDAVVSNWPVEVLAVSGGEVLRGRQVASETTHVMFGEYQAGESVTPDMRVAVTSSVSGSAVTYQIVSVLDVDGDGRELRIELKREL